MNHLDCHHKYSKSLPATLYMGTVLFLMSFLLTIPEAMSNEASGRWSPKKIDVQSDVTMMQLRHLLKQQSIEAEPASTGQVEYLVFTLSGHKSIIALYQCKQEHCGTIKMTTFFKPPKPIGAKQINTWNQTRRYTRAYLNKEGNPILEADIDLDGGAPKEVVVDFVMRQQSMIAWFAKFVSLPAKDSDLYAWQEVEGGQSTQETPKTVKPKETIENSVQSAKPEGTQTSMAKFGHSVSASNSSDLSTFVQPNGYIYLTVLKLDGDQPQGCPVIIEASNKTDFNLEALQLAVRIHIKDESSPWSFDRLYNYPSISRDGVEMDYKLGGTECDQIDRVEIMAVKKALVEGQPFPGLLEVVKEGEGGFVPLTVSGEVK